MKPTRVQIAAAQLRVACLRKMNQPVPAWLSAVAANGTPAPTQTKRHLRSVS